MLAAVGGGGGSGSYGQMPMGGGYPPFSAGQGAMAPPQVTPSSNYGTRSSGNPSGYGSDGGGSGGQYGSRSRGAGNTPQAPRTSSESWLSTHLVALRQVVASKGIVFLSRSRTLPLSKSIMMSAAPTVREQRVFTGWPLQASSSCFADLPDICHKADVAVEVCVQIRLGVCAVQSEQGQGPRPCRRAMGLRKESHGVSSFPPKLLCSQ